MAGASGLPPGVDERLQALLQTFSFAFVVSDCSKADMPIVFASSHFYEMTGYTADEVRGAGRNLSALVPSYCCNSASRHARHDTQLLLSLPGDWQELQVPARPGNRAQEGEQPRKAVSPTAHSCCAPSNECF